VVKAQIKVTDKENEIPVARKILARETLDEGLPTHPGQVVVRHEQLCQRRVVSEALRENSH
jgi:hypothetical protein